jgi:hypothetical protein
VATYYHDYQASAVWSARQPDEPREPFSPINDPFVPYVTTGTASVHHPGLIPNLYGD